jgi:DNA repair protein RadD
MALRDRFNQAGITAEHVDGSCSEDDREGKYERLQNGKTQILCSIDLLIEGVDFPGVSAAILWKRFGSLVQYRQACGRIMRPAPGKTRAVVLDHAGAAGVHGLPGDDVEWSLDENSTVDARRKKALKDGKSETVVMCHQCGLMFSGEPRCPACGWKPKHKSKPAAQKDVQQARDEVLSRYESGNADKIVAETRQRHWMSCLYITAARNSVLGAAAALFSKKFGVPPWSCGVKPLPSDRGDWKRPIVEVFPQFNKRGAGNVQG